MSSRRWQSSETPDLRSIRSVAGLIEKHRQLGHRYNGSTLAATWSALGKLVRNDRGEQDQLSREGRMLEPLVNHTLSLLPLSLIHI